MNGREMLGGPESLEKSKMKIVRIPKTLVEKLRPFGPRYIKVVKPIPGHPHSGKGAIEHGWQDHPYEAADPELQTWLRVGNNYGVKCGEGIVELDLDEEFFQLYPELAQKLPKTFTVESGSQKGQHRYYRSDITDNATLLTYVEGKQVNVGNIQARNKYVVGPGCNHYTGGTYRIINDAPIAWISEEQVEQVFGELLKWSQKQQAFNEIQAKWEGKQIGLQIPISEIIDLSDMRSIGRDEYQGSHPIHGSTTGVNFCVNVAKNCWHCFRCNSGGGPLSWLAVREGLMECEEARRGVLKGDLFWKAVEIAEREGFDVDLGKLKGKSAILKRWFWGSPPKFNHALMADELMEEHHYVTRKDSKVMYVYNSESGIYTPDGEEHIRARMQEILHEFSTTHRQNEVVNFVRNSSYKELARTPVELIALKNGLFNLRSRELLPFTPEYFILNALPIHYAPDADCHGTKKFISEIVTPEDAAILQEVSGYCLWREYKFHKAAMLVGEGANGKSTFLELLRAMLGKENVSTIALQQFEVNRFATANLHGKLANIYPDLPDLALKRTGVFKTLTGGDTVMAENKFQSMFSFENYAKLIFSANKLPESPDDTTAFFRRWIIVNFPNQFLPNDPKTDKNLLSKLTTQEELSGFFNWALEGLHRLLENGRFSTSRTVEETREDYIRKSAPIKAFAMDCIERVAGSVVPKDEVYEAFIKYCQKHNLPTCAKNRFAMKLPEYVPGITSTRKTVNKKQVYAWRDIQLAISTVSSRSYSPTSTDDELIEEERRRERNKRRLEEAEEIDGSLFDFLAEGTTEGR